MLKPIHTGSVAVVAVLALGLLGPAAAQTRSGGQPDNTTRSQQPAQQQLNEFDRNFVTEAYAGNMAEVELGRMVTEKARDEQVRQLGARLITDHQSANEKIAPIATQHQVQLPAQPKPEARALKEKLQRLSGAQFDRQFAQEAVREHQKDVDKYQKAAGQIRNPELRTYAQQTLPVLREHLQMAQRISRSLTPVASRSSSQREQMSGSTQGTRELPGATALLNQLSADGYRVTSDFSRSGSEWTAKAERNGQQVTISYDPQTRQYRTQ